ncbi:male sterility protein-domain-containing protein [Mycena pura]|uniref:Male sterility protein-domain-containing protein n=1 Tax=Mycena pura TaxID=153505 RepID=A0AAD6UMZ9_9AGAR|nr:male sterility protein-domain-containing protein [Mycena pura]
MSSPCTRVVEFENLKTHRTTTATQKCRCDVAVLPQSAADAILKHVVSSERVLEMALESFYSRTETNPVRNSRLKSQNADCTLSRYAAVMGFDDVCDNHRRLGEELVIRRIRNRNWRHNAVQYCRRSESAADMRWIAAGKSSTATASSMTAAAKYDDQFTPDSMLQAALQRQNHFAHTNRDASEAILLKNPVLKHAVMFGRGQFHAGVIVFPAHSVDLADTQQVDRGRGQPMILVADPAKPAKLTAKRTLRRQAVIDMYSDEIADLYEAVRGSSQTLPTVCDAASSLEFMREVVAEVMHDLPGDDDDIFQHGCDSLQATWIRNSVLYALRDRRGVDVDAIPTNFVYAHPTVRLLAELLTMLAAGEEISPSSEAEALAMAAMAQKYSHSFPVHCARAALTAEQPTAHTVLVTGTTGALGAHLLGHLLALPGVFAVYAFNRPRADVLASQRSALAENGLDARLADDPALRLLEGDLTAPEFGLAHETFEEMRASVTLIVHNGTYVNFNVSLASMEPLVAGTRQLVDFALSSPHAAPPRLLFVSSVGVFRRAHDVIFPGLASQTNWHRRTGWTGTTAAAEEPISDPKVSAGQGYAASKWVAETVLDAAARTTALKPVIVRAGQLSGAANGAWNFREWFPSLLRASQLLGHLPGVSGRVSWVPIHQAAGAIVEIMIQDSEARYLHLTHPHPVPFATLFAPLAEILGLPVVPYREWLDSLEAAAGHAVEAASSTGNNPGVRLMDFFRAVKEAAPEQEAFFQVAVANSRAAEAAPSLAALSPLAAWDVEIFTEELICAVGTIGIPMLPAALACGKEKSELLATRHSPKGKVASRWVVYIILMGLSTLRRYKLDGDIAVEQPEV